MVQAQACANGKDRVCAACGTDRAYYCNSGKKRKVSDGHFSDGGRTFSVRLEGKNGVKAGSFEFARLIGTQISIQKHAVSTRILGRRTAPFPPFRIPYRVPHGFYPRS